MLLYMNKQKNQQFILSSFALGVVFNQQIKLFRNLSLVLQMNDRDCFKDNYLKLQESQDGKRDIQIYL